MSRKKWFSAKLRFVVFVEPEGGDTANDCLYMLRATSYRTAFARAVAIGRAAETEYPNQLQQRVVWRLMDVISIDMISSDEFDGAKVHSELIHLKKKERIPFDAKFNPEESKVIQAI